MSGLVCNKKLENKFRPLKTELFIPRGLTDMAAREKSI